VGDALIYFQLTYERASQREVHVFLFFHDGDNGGHLFYDTAKHVLGDDYQMLLFNDKKKEESAQ
jgi:hypothetical protein